MYKRLLAILVLFVTLSAFNNSNKKNEQAKKIDPKFIAVQNNWVDSVFNSLTEEERIAQLFIISAYSNKNQEHVDFVNSMIEKYNVGGLIFFQGGPYRQTELINKYQKAAKTPLLIGQDAEWGVGMRLDSTIDFPHQMMLGAIQNDSMLYEFGKEVALQCKAVGVQINFAPVVDINNNPANPVINARSFGEEKENVARKSFFYMKGMQDNGILTSAKHFPGHGDTDADSHYTLPLIKHNKKRIQDIELYPYKYLIKRGLSGVMVAHLSIPSLEKDKNRPSTLSYDIINNLLKKKLKFEGLIYTDALNMKGVANHYAPGRIEIEAILAGNDILLFPLNVANSIDSIKSAVKRGEVTQERIDESCKKILKAKYWAGLGEFKTLKNNNIAKRMNSEEQLHLKRNLVENAITLVENNDVIPIQNLDTLRIASISIGSESTTIFQKSLKLYTIVDDYQINRDADLQEFEKLIHETKDYNLIIIGVHNTNQHPSKKFGITQNSIDFIHKLTKSKKVILDLFSNPYSLKYFEKSVPEAIVMSYEDDIEVQDLSAQLIFGGIPSLGKLPVTASERFHVRKGIVQKKKSD
jgi:beta-N-acetylhexosaminidase